MLYEYFHEKRLKPLCRGLMKHEVESSRCCEFMRGSRWNWCFYFLSIFLKRKKHTNKISLKFFSEFRLVHSVKNTEEKWEDFSLQTSTDDRRGFLKMTILKCWGKIEWIFLFSSLAVLRNLLSTKSSAVKKESVVRQKIRLKEKKKSFLYRENYFEGLFLY